MPETEISADGYVGTVRVNTCGCSCKYFDEPINYNPKQPLSQLIGKADECSCVLGNSIHIGEKLDCFKAKVVKKVVKGH